MSTAQEDCTQRSGMLDCVGKEMKLTPQEERLVQKLREMGIQVTTHPVDNSPFFYEWELRYAFVRVQRQNIDSALLDFLEALLLFVPVEEKRDFHE